MDAQRRTIISRTIMVDLIALNTIECATTSVNVISIGEEGTECILHVEWKIERIYESKPCYEARSEVPEAI